MHSFRFRPVQRHLTRCASLALASVFASAPAMGYELTRLTVVEDPLILGRQANGGASACAIADDGGAIVFTSTATQLIATDDNGVPDIYVDSGAAVARISRKLDGAQSPWAASAADLSQNGRFVVYALSFDFSAPLFSPGADSVYRYDRVQQQVLLVSENAQNSQPGTGRTPVISDDGDVVVFVSPDQLLGADNNGFDDIYRYEVSTDTLSLVSISTGGGGGNGDSDHPSVDGSGDIISFDSAASDLIGTDNNGVRDVFVRDVLAGTTARVNRSTAGTVANTESFALDISDDGNMVLFRSAADNLDDAVADTNAVSDVFRRNRAMNITRRATLTSSDGEFAEGTTVAAISGDGQFVVFSNRGSLNSTPQAWRKNLANGNLIQLTDTESAAINEPDISEDGSQICFHAGGRSFVDLDPGDANGQTDMYRASVTGTAVTIVREGEPATAIASAVSATPPRLVDIDDAGTRILVASNASQFDAGTFFSYPTGTDRLYLIDRFTGAVTDVCGLLPGIAIDRGCTLGALSGDGNYAFFASAAQNLHPDTASSLRTHFYRKNLTTGVVDLVTRNTVGIASAQSSDTGFDVDADFDGSRFVFFSRASDLVSGDSNNVADAFLWDATTGIRRISVRNNGVEAVVDPELDVVRISSDGDRIVFAHAGTNLVAGDGNGLADLFMYTVSSPTPLARIAQPPSETTARSSLADLSADGRYVSFQSSATQYTDPANTNLFLWDRLNPTATIAIGENVINGGASFLGGGTFDRGSTALVFTAGENVDSPVHATAVYRRELAGNADIEQARAPVDPSLNEPPYRFSGARVANDRSIFIAADWATDVTDNNGVNDIFEVASGFGYAAFTSASVDVPESAGTVQITVVRSHGAAFDADLNVDATAGSAQSGTDFTFTNAAFYVWLDGESGPRTSPLQIIDDTTAEATESLTLTLSNPSNISLRAPTVLTVNIIDNDGPLFANGFE